MHRSVVRKYAFVFGSLCFIGAAFLYQERKVLLPSFLLTARIRQFQDVSVSQPRGNIVISIPTFAPSPAPSTAPPRPQYPRAKSLDRKATIVVQLSGEMANNLHHIAHGLGLQIMAKEEYDIDCNLILRHHEGPNNRSPRPKWKSARDNIQQCFPKLSTWDFAQGNNNVFLDQQKLQQSWLRGKSDHLFGLVNSQNISEIRRGLEFLSEDILKDPDRPWVDEKKSVLRMPYLYLETLDILPIIDSYYDQIRELLVFNNTACCARIPESQDSVFHFRNYESEMPERRAFEMGFAELAPFKVANEVFAHSYLQAANSTSVRITTRIFNQKARNYAEALQARGIPASVVTDQSAVQDFCFLKETKMELVGSARSTFVMWAALLGNVQKARLYHVDNRGLRERHPDFWERFTHNFTHPRLRDRVWFELYHADS